MPRRPPYPPIDTLPFEEAKKVIDREMARVKREAPIRVRLIKQLRAAGMLRSYRFCPHCGERLPDLAPR